MHISYQFRIKFKVLTWYSSRSLANSSYSPPCSLLSHHPGCFLMFPEHTEHSLNNDDWKTPLQNIFLPYFLVLFKSPPKYGLIRNSLSVPLYLLHPFLQCLYLSFCLTPSFPLSVSLCLSHLCLFSSVYHFVSS